MRGKLIVIDGNDGSGKATQVGLLLKYLKKRNRKTAFIDFPRYYTSFHGRIVARYLTGEFGGVNEVNPYLASLTYALDRLSAKPDMDKWIREGKIVVANRYVSSNMAYQSAKLPSGKRAAFLRWLSHMEYGIHKLPKENVVIYLHVPVDVGQELISRKKARKYLRGKTRDIHEDLVSYQQAAEQMYLKLCRANPHWIKIECMGRDGKLRALADIHEQIVELLKERKVIK